MSTTRWIIETVCETCGGSGSVTHPAASEREHLEGLREDQCPACSSTGVVWGSRIVVDPDNLPPEAIQRANQAWHDEWLKWARSDIDWNMAEADSLRIMKAIITAFLSDPEPGDQT